MCGMGPACRCVWSENRPALALPGWGTWLRGTVSAGQSSHRYVFDLYALDRKLNLPAGVSKKDVVKAMDGHVLGWGEVVGRFGR
jgi:phosphatidylethanolamine-binding protein (PEBP) family uncharacterized protein